MSDSIDLAGAIGTWVAVFLALVALGGILPGIFLYRASKTQKAQALALVDDPDQSFVRHVNLPGMRLSRLSGIPDLREPPNLQALDLMQPPEPRRLGSQQSTTCWINFAQIVNALFPGIKTASGEDALEYEDGQSYLPVHCLWILLLGVLHRYGARYDLGLPLDVAPQRSIDLPDYEDLIYGLSGSLMSRHATSDNGQLKLLFETHPHSVVKRALEQSKMSVSNLVLLSLGYIELSKGAYFAMHDTLRRRNSRSRSQSKISSYARKSRIVVLEEQRMPREHASIVQRIGLEIPNVKILLLEDSEEVLPKSLVSRLSPELLRDNGYYKIGAWKPVGRDERTADIWMEEKEVRRIVMTYLEQPMDLNGVLYETFDEVFVRRVLKADDLQSTVELAKSMVAHLDYPESRRLNLRSKLDAFAPSDFFVVSWSRHAMRSLQELDEAITAVFATEDFKWQSVSTLYAYDVDFRLNFK